MEDLCQQHQKKIDLINMKLISCKYSPRFNKGLQVEPRANLLSRKLDVLHQTERGLAKESRQ